ncbi:signal peptidase I, partial [Candidatus Saccharibacteria bacterium]|nr:signal peptidase I [Candidatus Saccharibacteria bacterium]
MKVLFIIVVVAIAVLVYWYLFPPKKKKKKEEDKAPRSRKAKVFEIGEVLVTALILALIIRALAVQAFTIPSGSMKPTLLVGDYVLVNKFVYGPRVPFTDSRFFELKSPKRGEVIVFKYPKDHTRDFIKRVIGTPGDVVEVRNKMVYVNGKQMREPYARHSDEYVIYERPSPRDNYGPVTVPEDKYFVMGDNRDESEDSRYWGFVDIDEIKGKAFIIYWSAD